MSSRGSKKCIVECDGASKGNPGRAGAGVVLRSEDGRVFSRVSQGLGHATNNEAEYKAVHLGMKTALEKGYTDIIVKTDSQLVSKQVQGHWQTRNPNMRELRDEARGLKNEFRSVDIRHVDREFNSEADSRANFGTNLQPGEVRYDSDSDSDSEDDYDSDSEDDY